MKKMQKRVLRKIKSTKGASLSIAILLFMVCAVLGGIILASATAAGGRVRNLSDSDKRYYNITSAAQLLAEELSRKQVVIERKKTYYAVTDAAGQDLQTAIPAGITVPPATYTVKTVESKDQGDAVANYSFLAREANYLLFGQDLTKSAEVKWNASFSDVTLEDEDSLSFDADNGNAFLDHPAVHPANTFEFVMKLYGNTDQFLCQAKFRYFLQKDGTLVLETWNINPDGTEVSEDKYVLRVVMKPDFTEQQIDEDKNMVPVAANAQGDGEGVAFLTEKIITKTATVSWQLSSIKKMEK